MAQRNYTAHCTADANANKIKAVAPKNLISFERKVSENFVSNLFL
jgi:hypothetical protein